MRLAAMVFMLVWAAAAGVIGGCAAGRGMAASAPVAREERFEFARVCMGVRTTVTLYAPDQATASDAAAAAFARIGELDDCMSDYRATSELMRLCASPAGRPVAVSADLFEVLRVSQAIAKASGGAFDVTIGPAVRLWREARRTGRLPSEAERAGALESVGWEHLRLDDRARTVTLRREHMRLDLGGIAKGYAAEAAVETLKSLGRPRCLVALEGDIAAGEPPPGERGWRIEIAGLPERGPLLLASGSVSTAGDEGQFMEIDGRRYSHIIDPRTGLGSGERRSVTVVAFGPRAGAIADGLDTPCYLLGSERGAGLIGAFKGAAAIVREEASGEVGVIDPAGVLRGRWAGR